MTKVLVLSFVLPSEYDNNLNTVLEYWAEKGHFDMNSEAASPFDKPLTGPRAMVLDSKDYYG